MKGKTCKACGSKFTPERAFQAVCCTKCGITHAKTLISRASKRKATRDKREARVRLRTRSEWLAIAQESFNKWVRLRDKDLACVSCGRFHEGKVNAGHYLSRGARPELRFEPLNVWKQCEPCNSHLSGNIALFRVELIKRIGMDKVEWLEGPHPPKKYTVDEIKDIAAKYKRLSKEIGDKHAD